MASDTGPSASGVSRVRATLAVCWLSLAGDAPFRRTLASCWQGCQSNDACTDACSAHTHTCHSSTPRCPRLGDSAQARPSASRSSESTQMRAAQLHAAGAMVDCC